MVKALKEITLHLENGILPFWLENGTDKAYGGYLTCFDENGQPESDKDKYIITQTRMIWGLSALLELYPENRQLLEEVKQGVNFFIKHFWDKEYGGWYWKVSRDGIALDKGKVVYGQSFAIYALVQFTLSTGDPIGLEYAEKTFDLLQVYCADTYRGGYYENLEEDWSLSSIGFNGGDRKSLDIHMHLMEAFTTLVQCSGKEVHRRKLEEVIELILKNMVNYSFGCGLNQFDLDFNPIPAINIRRTWNAERSTGEILSGPLNSTSYGHNVELAWLLNRAGEVLKKPADYFNNITRSLVEHSLKYGLDYEFGGVYRDGPHYGDALVRDKEWWQNCEVLVGYLDAYEKLGDKKYLEAFEKVWNFSNEYFIDHTIGEWRQLLNRKGEVIDGSIGNPWKAIYHSGRSMMECKQRLKRMADI